MIKSLEFRGLDGKFLFEITGDNAEAVYNKLVMLPNFTKRIKSLSIKAQKGKGETFTVLECVHTFGVELFNMLKFVLVPGDYIKIILS